MSNHDLIDYGPLVASTWQDHGYPGRTNLGDVNLTTEQPEIRNMTKEQVDRINEKWNTVFNRGWGPDVKLNTTWAVVPEGTPTREDMPIVDPLKAAQTTPRVQFDRDLMWVNYWDNRFN